MHPLQAIAAHLLFFQDIPPSTPPTSRPAACTHHNHQPLLIRRAAPPSAPHTCVAVRTHPSSSACLPATAARSSVSTASQPSTASPRTRTAVTHHKGEPQHNRDWQGKRRFSRLGPALRQCINGAPQHNKDQQDKHHLALTGKLCGHASKKHHGVTKVCKASTASLQGPAMS